MMPPLSSYARFIPVSRPDFAVAQVADLHGNRDGLTSSSELRTFADSLKLHRNYAGDGLEFRQVQRAIAALGHPRSPTSTDTARNPGSQGIAGLSPRLREIAMNIDTVWGNADGRVHQAEISKVAAYYLPALAYFTDEAAQLIELAQALSLSDAPIVGTLHRELNGLKDCPSRNLLHARALLDEAIAEADLPGAPSLLRDVRYHSPQWHGLGVLQHITTSVAAVEALADTLADTIAGTLADTIADTTADTKAPLSSGEVLAGPNAKQRLSSTMLLHDIGKVLGRRGVSSAAARSYRFTDHEHEGADWLRQRNLDPDILWLVENHMIIRPNSAQSVIASCGNDASRVGELVMVYVADQVAKGNTPDQLKSFEQQTPKLRELCKFAGLDAGKLLERAGQLRLELFATDRRGGGQ